MNVHRRLRQRNCLSATLALVEELVQEREAHLVVTGQVGPTPLLNVETEHRRGCAETKAEGTDTTLVDVWRNEIRRRSRERREETRVARALAVLRLVYKVRGARGWRLRLPVHLVEHLACHSCRTK